MSTERKRLRSSRWRLLCGELCVLQSGNEDAYLVAARWDALLPQDERRLRALSLVRDELHGFTDEDETGKMKQRVSISTCLMLMLMLSSSSTITSRYGYLHAKGYTPYPRPRGFVLSSISTRLSFPEI